MRSQVKDLTLTCDETHIWEGIPQSQYAVFVFSMIFLCLLDCFGPVEVRQQPIQHAACLVVRVRARIDITCGRRKGAVGSSGGQEECAVAQMFISQ